ncbi:hypothetical protein KKG22_01715 [Patescibacteria group bacterium]|nr:hypothetical protein [Patescibacteria group bacterium]MBU1721948.1 hypothetical protein [Patescibacteria group bacterium]MBU1901769.1 hypothetical protein [Patescibacteria group bacterium]
MSLLSKLFGRSDNHTTNKNRSHHTQQHTQPQHFMHSTGTIQVDNIFKIKSLGTILTGKVISGGVAVGFTANHNGQPIVINRIETFNKQEKSVETGESAGFLIDEAQSNQVKKGDTITFRKN